MIYVSAVPAYGRDYKWAKAVRELGRRQRLPDPGHAAQRLRQQG